MLLEDSVGKGGSAVYGLGGGTMGVLLEDSVGERWRVGKLSVESVLGYFRKFVC